MKKRIVTISGLIVLMLCICNTSIQSEENDEKTDGKDRLVTTLGKVTIDNSNIDINLYNGNAITIDAEGATTMRFYVDYDITIDRSHDAEVVLHEGGGQLGFIRKSTSGSGRISGVHDTIAGTSFTLTLTGRFNINGGEVASLSRHVTITITEPPNNPPNKPSLSGPTAVKVGTSSTYRTTISDPDGDSMNISWNWGSGGYTNLEGPYPSGIIIDRTHTWTESDLNGASSAEFYIRVKADDGNGGTTCSDPLRITLSKNNNDNDTDNETNIPNKIDIATKLQTNELMYNNTIQYSQSILLQLLATEPIIIQYKNI